MFVNGITYVVFLNNVGYVTWRACKKSWSSSSRRFFGDLQGHGITGSDFIIIIIIIIVNEYY